MNADDTYEITQYQSLPKELPRFSSSLEEWFMLNNAFENSTNLCELSNFYITINGHTKLEIIREKLFYTKFMTLLLNKDRNLYSIYFNF